MRAVLGHDMEEGGQGGLGRTGGVSNGGRHARLAKDVLEGLHGGRRGAGEARVRGVVPAESRGRSKEARFYGTREMLHPTLGGGGGGWLVRGWCMCGNHSLAGQLIHLAEYGSMPNCDASRSMTKDLSGIDDG